MTSGRTFLVVGRQPWNRTAFDAILADADGNWCFSNSAEQLLKFAEENVPFRYVFFLHWSNIVPSAVLEKYECVCFHMTDVPYGRGGSPLQNLIARGHRATVLTALRMTANLDAGPVYMKWPFSLEGGSAEEIYARASRQSCRMAAEIAAQNPAPVDQTGEVVIFKRRKPDQSKLPVNDADLMDLFDHIRMLDADGYPRAYVEVGDFRFEFSRAGLYHDGIRADVRISKKDQGEDS